MDCGIIAFKSVLLFLSLIFLAAGAFMAYVGSYVIKSYNSFDSFIHDRYTLIPAAIIIGISVVMFIVGIVGCCSTIRESKLGLGFFFFVIMIIFAVEVAALLCALIFRGRINQDLDSSMTVGFAKYNGEDTNSKAVDYLQTQFQCCGVKNYSSWINTTWFSRNNTMPVSCCKQNTTSQCTGRLDQLSLINTEGCEVKLENFIQEYLTYAILVILGFAIVKLFGMLGVCVITCKSNNRRNGYESFDA